MATPNQKADARPISFVLHDMATGEPPVEVKLVIRPEDLTRTDTSRLSTTQTLGGAWADNFGPGIPTVQISGHTGWGSADRPDGLAEFQKLHSTIFKGWHQRREDALRAGLDPDLVKLIFADYLDDFTWVVAPQTFVLKRNKSRPLLSQYQINLTYLSTDVAVSMITLDGIKRAEAAAAVSGDADVELSLSELEMDGLESMLASVERIDDFIKSGIANVLGPVQAAFNQVVSLTANVLKAVYGAIKTGMGIVSALTNGLIGLATSLTRAAANITNIVQGILSIPDRIKAQFQRVALAFENAFCVLKNIFRRRKFLPNYNDLYGASLCSSTAGGRPLSRYESENYFPVLYPVNTSAVSVSGPASSALNRLSQADPVLAPPTKAMLAADMSAVGSGVAVAA